jgi:hypothetical protein
MKQDTGVPQGITKPQAEVSPKDIERANSESRAIPSCRRSSAPQQMALLLHGLHERPLVRRLR